MAYRIKRRLALTYALVSLIPILLLATFGYMWLSRNMLAKGVGMREMMLEENVRQIEEEFKQIETMAIQFRSTFWVEKFVNMQGNEIDMNRISAYELSQYKQYVYACKTSLKNVEQLGLYFTGKDYVVAAHGNSDFNFLINKSMRIEGFDEEKWNTVLNSLTINKPKIVQGVTVSKYGSTSEGTLFLEKIQPVNSSLPDCIVFAYIKNERIDNFFRVILESDNGYLIIMDPSGVSFRELGSPSVGKNIIIQKYSSVMDCTYRLSIPEKSILEELILARNFLLGVVFSLLILCELISSFFSRGIYKPIEDLVKTLKRNVDINPKNEILFIKNGINELISKQNTLSEKISKQMQELSSLYIGMLILDFGKNSRYFIEELSKVNIVLDKPFFNIYIMTRRTPSGIPLPPYSIDKVHSILADLNTQEASAYANISNNCQILINYNDKSSFFEYTKKLSERFPNSIILVGEQTENLSEISSIFHNVNHMSTYRHYARDNRIIYYEENFERYFFPLKSEFELSAAISAGNNEMAVKIFKQLYQENCRREDIMDNGIHGFLINCCMTATRVAMDTVPQGKGLKSLSELTAMENECLYYHTEDMINVICQRIQSFPENDPLFNKILEYVDAAIEDSSLSLNQIADTFNVSISFVSKIFKRKGHVKFHKYVNGKRIEHSKSLLTTTDLTIANIAKLVGYDNDVTFRRLFKQFVGTSPGKFKQTR